MQKALIAMSGGVDSSLAAKLMQDAGYECIGCTMRLHDYKDIATNGGTCGSTKDAEDAKSICDNLGIPFCALDYKEGFKENVIKRFVEAYEAGRTPNPCIYCNRYMKFEGLFSYAKELGCEYVVTGHYARIEKDGDKYQLKKATDETKDQSYVLYSMTQEQLKHTMFPLGDLKKTDVRKIAEDNNFVTASKPDSQDICFVPDGDYASFLEKYTGKVYEQGNFVDCKGNIVGTHNGIVRYTIGQRKGLGIAFGKPMYVKKLDTENNTVILAEDDELFEKELTVGDFNWISGEAPKGQIVCKAKIRYRQKEQPAKAYVLPDGRVKLEFDEPQRAITSGQAAVLYDGDVVLGGGIIE